MFLKRIEAYGFKSFADKTVIQFQEGITGIVGPNGCGKSNISDSVRWVLGEQSVKSLRGGNMSDVIFAGSQGRKPLNVAEVTLVFDNTKRQLQTDYNEVQITRRLYRTNNEAEYLINNQLVRLKDIVDLVMDTGLGRDSLSIISQGNISRFADSKPEERRMIFEEAAGVAKYKKRKIESIRKLERTSEHLKRIEDIIHELEIQVNPLKKQAEKAKQYLEYKAQLETTEIALIVKEIEDLNERLINYQNEASSIEYTLVTSENELQIKEVQIDKTRQLMNQLDLEINGIQGELLNVMNELAQLEAQKAEIDERRKNQINSDNQDEKIINLKQVIDDGIYEIEDRIKRLDLIKQEVETLEQNRRDYKEEVEVWETTYQDYNNQIHRMDNRKELLKNLLEQKNQYSTGVKAILSAKDSLYGVEGTVNDLIKVENDFSFAISTALGAANAHIVMKNQSDTKDAITYLKKNQAGRATFLPMDVIQGRSVSEDIKIAVSTIEGYLGLGVDYIQCDKKYQHILSNLLGNVFITKDIKSAVEVSNLLNNRFKVVSLEGDVVSAGGSMTGGKYRSSNQMQNQIEFDEINKNIPIIRQKMNECKNKTYEINQELDNLTNILIQKQVSKAKIEEVIQTKKQKVNHAKNEYESLTNETYDDSKKVNDNQMLEKITLMLSTKDAMVDEIKSKRETRMNLNNQIQSTELDSKTLQIKVNQCKKDKHEIEINVTKDNLVMDGLIERLAKEYQMTFEHAKEIHVPLEDYQASKIIVQELRQNISKLGFVNIEAIEEYEVVKTRYEFLNEQKDDLVQAQNTILDTINELDQVMIHQFSKTFDEVSKHFNQVFQELFGGGHGILKYTDPTNILETGIDIEVQPPGKAVQNISLFSGGEKALIAISGLFAILKAKPIPLCILDEVEAALDQVNIERFAKYLKNFSGETQFIVVTHRAGTMEECDLLYGVTMQEQGVTKMFSVQLEDAQELVNTKEV